jgi:ankyrin repeat protein
VSVAEQLLNAGAAINLASERGFTPLHAAAYEGRLAMVELLLARGAIPTVKTADGKTPADLARVSQHQDVVARLEATGGEKP